METKGKLVFVRWHIKTAVYLNGDLLFYEADETTNWRLLEKLGYKCDYGTEVPRAVPPEFERDKINQQHWKPPQLLSELWLQFAKYRKRIKQEKIASLRWELARLEIEEDG